MNRTIVLDSGPLGVLSNPARSAQVVACNRWLASMVARGYRIIVPEIADYEVRRELVRANRTTGIARLDALGGRLEYLPLTTGAMRLAASFWAQARQQGRPTAPDPALDGGCPLGGSSSLLRPSR